MKYNYVDMVLLKGKILTMDACDSVVEAVAVDKGVIVGTGNSDEIIKMAGSHTEVIDLKGKTMIPGFIDAHTHIDLYGTMTSEHAVSCHVPPLKSTDDILEKIKKAASEKPEGAMIICQGRVDQQYPTKEQLDRVAPEHPVLIKAAMHNYILNSCALNEFGINKDRPSFEELYDIVPGAVVVRDPVTGEPTGWLEESWDYLFPRSQSPFSYRETYAGIKKGLDDLSRYGVTSIAEFLCYPESPRIYQELYRNDELNVRVQLIPCFHGINRTVELDEVINAGFTSGFGDEWVKFGGLKMFVDLQQDTTCTSVQLNEWFKKAHRAGIRMLMHAITRKGQEMALAAIEREADSSGLEGIKKMRHRIEHMGNEGHDLDFLRRVKELNAIAVPTAYFLSLRPFKLMSAPTEKKYMFRTMLDMGLCVPGNSDCAGSIPECLNPMYEIWCMVNRKSFDGEIFIPSEKISVLEALRVYTIHAAYADHEEKVKGSVEVGKLADFAVFSEDPLTVDEDHLKELQIAMTIVNGQVVYQQ